MVVTMTALGAIVAIITGILVAKPFLIFVGIGLFLVGFLGVATLSETWVVPLVIVLVIIIMLTGGKKK